MNTNNNRIFVLFTLAIMGVLLFTITACGPKFDSPSANPSEKPVGLPGDEDQDVDNSQPTTTPRPIDIAKDELATNLLDTKGIVGVGIGDCNGSSCIRVYLENESPELKAKVPAQFHGFVVVTEVSGPIEMQAGQQVSEEIQTGQQVSETTVELDIYSGLPNPTWTIAPALASDLEGRIASLNSSREISECPQNLGYRGFIVQSLDAQSNSIQTLHACRGVIKVTDAIGSRYYVDPQRQIELWLLASSALAQPPISEELAAQIVKEINAP